MFKNIPPDGKFEWSHVLVIQLIDICSSLEQNLDNLLSATTDSIVKRCGVSVSQWLLSCSHGYYVTWGNISGWHPLPCWVWSRLLQHCQPWRHRWDSKTWSPLNCVTCEMCWSVRGCQRSVHHPGDVAPIRAVLPVYYSLLPSCVCCTEQRSQRLTGSRRNSDTLCTMANIMEWVFFIDIDHLAACCVAPVKYVRQRIFSTTPDTYSPKTTEDLLLSLIHISEPTRPY